MTAGVLLGGALGAALCLLVFALVPPRPQLASVVGRWERQRARRPRRRRSLDVEDIGWQERLGRWLVAAAGAARHHAWASCAPTSS